ncbi:hypothetical protein [Marivita sp. S2033]|uniref:hypothetical protein n=1 Tax=Marivita sp. S2033 TaxID=3373187 RepID=UPI0039823CF6
MVAITFQEIAVSLAIMLLGITGALSVAAAAIAVSPKINQTVMADAKPKTRYPSLLVRSAFGDLASQSPTPVLIRVHIKDFITPSAGADAFVTKDDHIAMILAQIMARWGETDAMHLSDDQARELWLIERLLRASPAEAGELSACFSNPKAMLAMRDRVAQTGAA